MPLPRYYMPLFTAYGNCFNWFASYDMILLRKAREYRRKADEISDPH
jgi:hypothetical protein